jgi:hypothetical protein
VINERPVKMKCTAVISFIPVLDPFCSAPSILVPGITRKMGFPGCIVVPKLFQVINNFIAKP